MPRARFMSRTAPACMAGFQVIIYGRFWVITEASSTEDDGGTNDGVGHAQFF